MEWHETVKVIAEVIIAIYTIVLARATITLSKHTKSLDEHEFEHRRDQGLRRCIYLAQLIIGPNPEEMDSWLLGNLTNRSVQPFGELLSLGKYIYDADTKRQLENFYHTMNNALLEDRNITQAIPEFEEKLKKFRGRLTMEIINWQRDLGNYLIT